MAKRTPTTRWKVYKQRHPKATQQDFIRHLRRLANKNRTGARRPQGDYNQDINMLLAQLAPISQGDIEQHAMNLVGQLFGGQEQQIQSGFQQAMMASSSVPSMGGAAAQAGQTAASLLSGLAGQVGGYYSGAIGQQTAADQATVNQLMTGAQEIGGSIAQQLASAGLPTTEGVQVGQQAADSAGVLSAIDNAAITQLRQQGAAAQSYAASLPGLAMAQGAADAAMFDSIAGREAAARNAEIASQQASSMADLRSQRANAILELISQAEGREYDKAVTRLTFDETIRKLRQQERESRRGVQENRRDRRFRAAQAALDREIRIQDMMQRLQISREQAAARIRAAEISAADEESDEAASNRRADRAKVRNETIASARSSLENWSQPRREQVEGGFGEPPTWEEVPGTHRIKRADAMRQLASLFKSQMPWLSPAKRAALVRQLVNEYYGPVASAPGPSGPPGPGS